MKVSTNIHELLEQSGETGSRFQSDLAKFIIDNNIQTIVETGSGTSTLHILKAIEKRGSGKLYSIDPEPVCNYEIKHPQYELIKKRSIDAISDLYLNTGEWDLFLHDSDHDILCQTYEYDMALICVKNGGYIFSDDYEWNAHFSWAKFLEKNNLKQIYVGNIAGAKVITDSCSKDEIKALSKKYLSFAKEAEKEWLNNGNKNTWDIVYAGTNRKQ